MATRKTSAELRRQIRELERQAEALERVEKASEKARKYVEKLGRQTPKTPKIKAPRTSLNAPPGWRLTTVNGTRRAINPQGQNVSYGQYLNAQARRSGFKSHSDYRKQAKQVALFRTTPEAKKKLALGSPELKFLKQRILTPGKVNDPAPGGRLAQFLEAIGYRPKNATYPVGETPSGDKR